MSDSLVGNSIDKAPSQGKSQVKFKWHRSPIDRKVLAQLTKRRNLRPLVDNIAQLGFMAGTTFLALYAFKNWSWPLIVIATYFHWTLFAHYGSAAHHELCHRTVFKSRFLNEFFLRIAAFINWNDYTIFRHSHAGHHEYTTHNDFDLEVVLPLNIRRIDWFWAFTINIPGVYRFLRNMLRRTFRLRRDKIFLSEWERRIFPEDDVVEIRKVQWWSRFVVFGHLGLATLFIVTGNWYLIVLTTFGFLFARWFTLLMHAPQHIGMRPDVADWRQSTRTFFGGPIVNFFYWSMQYHVEHHMYAAVPYYNLSKLRKEIGWDLPLASKGLFAMWKEIIGTVKQQKEDPNYYFLPPLPKGATPYLEPTELNPAEG